MTVKLQIEERSIIGDGSQFKREFVVRAASEDVAEGEADRLMTEIRAAAKKQVGEWELAMRDSHYRMTRRSMIAQMLNSIIEGETTADDLLPVIMETTSEVLDADEMEIIRREVDFACRLAAVKNNDRKRDEDDGVEVQTFRIERNEGQGYGRRRRE